MGTQTKDLDNGPEDKFKLVYIIFYWLGIGTLLPWNMFITVRQKLGKCLLMKNYLSSGGSLLELQIPHCWGARHSDIGSFSLFNETYQGEKITCPTPKAVLGNQTESAALECGSEGGPPNDLQKAWGGYLAVARYIFFPVMAHWNILIGLSWLHLHQHGS